MPDNAIELDETSLHILDLLQTNADISNAESAERIGLSASPCWRRVTEMKEKVRCTGQSCWSINDPCVAATHCHVEIVIVVADKHTVKLRAQRIYIHVRRHLT